MTGKVVSKGIGIGRIKKIKPYQPIGIIKSDSPEVELEKLFISKKTTANEIKTIAEKTRKNVGDHEAEIFEAHLMILEDPTLLPQIETKITEESLLAESAVEYVLDSMKQMFESMDSDYMKERALDILDIKKRWISNFKNNEVVGSVTDDVILVAEELTPSDLLELDQNLIVGLLMEKGGVTSHAAILAQSMNIPALVGCGSLEHLHEGIEVILDANKNLILDQFTIEEKNDYVKAFELEVKRQNELKKMIGLNSITKDGIEIEIAANIAGPQDIESVLEYDGEGIGLFRTEFIFMNRTTPPTEVDQFKIYKSVVELMAGKPVIIRTMDIGGDKEVPYLNMPKEYNPFLGYRAIRYCLKETNFFKIQLRAILRAAKFGKVKIMFPMIASVSEFLAAKELVDEVRDELKHEGLEYGDVLLGIMIEIPSAAIQTKAFCKHVDFLSIGTNDLTQYTLAVDRQNEQIGELYDYFHPAVLHLIKHVITTAKAHDTWVGMCGSAAGDMALIPFLLSWGIDEISMASTLMLEARALIRSISLKDYKQLSDRLDTFENTTDVKENIKKLSVELSVMNDN